MVARAWFKKYTILCSFLSSEKKYLLKEYLIISSFGLACFKINHVIVWPVSFTLFMLPLSVLFLDWPAQRTGKAEEKEISNGVGDIRIENIAI